MGYSQEEIDDALERTGNAKDVIGNGLFTNRTNSENACACEI
jgi:hypothetical protein